MPAKRYPVILDPEQRDYLLDLITSGTESARKLTRGRILLKADEGELGPGGVMLPRHARCRNQRVSSGRKARTLNETRDHQTATERNEPARDRTEIHRTEGVHYPQCSQARKNGHKKLMIYSTSSLSQLV